MRSFTIEEFFELKPKMYSILVSNSSEYKRPKCLNENVVAKKCFLKKCLRHYVYEKNLKQNSKNRNLWSQQNSFVLL